MKTSAAALCLLGLTLPALAQELAPSPTQSIDCVPHDDHWHCEGPRPAPTPEGTTTEPVPVVTLTTAPVDDESTDAAGTGVLAPSPTQSVGCEPHGDHWHCESSRPADIGGGETSTIPADTLTTVTTTASSGTASGIEASSTATSAEPPVVTAGAARAIGAPLLGLAALAALGL